MPSGTDLTSSTPTINGADRRNSTDGNASNGSSFTRTVSFVISLIIFFLNSFSKSCGFIFY